MIKYIIAEDRRTVVATLSNTQDDVIKKIRKMLDGTKFSVALDAFKMPKSFRVEVKCDPRDDFDPEVGMAIAKKRLMERYYRSFDKRIGKLYEMLLQLNGKIFEISEIDVSDFQ